MLGENIDLEADLRTNHPDEDITRERSETNSSIYIGHCNHREHFKFAFNLGLFFSLIFLMLETLYSYEESTRDALVIYLWVVRAVYYLTLGTATTIGLKILLRSLHKKVCFPTTTASL